MATCLSFLPHVLRTSKVILFSTGKSEVQTITTKTTSIPSDFSALLSLTSDCIEITMIKTLKKDQKGLIPALPHKPVELSMGQFWSLHLSAYRGCLLPPHLSPALYQPTLNCRSSLCLSSPNAF